MLDRLLCEQINKHLEKNWYTFTSAISIFRNYSTETAFTKVVSDVIIAVFLLTNVYLCVWAALRLHNI